MTRLYRLMLFAYPAPMRHAFGRDMSELFSDLIREERRQNGRLAALTVALRSFFDVPVSAAQARRTSEASRAAPHSRRTDNRGAAPRDPRRGPHFRLVDGDYLELMGIELIRGRKFDTGDTLEAFESEAGVMLINESLAELAFPDRDPLSVKVTFGGDDFQIVGIVSDTAYDPHSHGAGRRPCRGARHGHAPGPGAHRHRRRSRYRRVPGTHRLAVVTAVRGRAS